MLGYNQRTPDNKIGGYSIESYEPEMQEEERRPNQSYFHLPVKNNGNSYSKNFSKVPYIIPQIINPTKRIVHPNYLSNLIVLNQKKSPNPAIPMNQAIPTNPTNLSYSFQYNTMPVTNMKYPIHNSRRNQINYQENQKQTKYLYPIRTLDIINNGKEYNIPQINFTRINEPIIRSKTIKFTPIYTNYQIVNKPTLLTNIPSKAKYVQPTIFLNNSMNPVYKIVEIKQRHYL